MELRHKTYYIFLISAVCVLAAMPVCSQCKQWYVGGTWEIEQHGLNYAIVLTLDQKDHVLKGTAGISINKYYPVSKVKGTIDGDRVNFKIFWFDGSTGVYDAKFLSSGRLDGNGYEEKTPNITVIWQSRKQFKCPPPASFNVPLNGYKPKPKPVDPPTKPKTETPPPPMKVPGIVASQVIYVHPTASMGFVVLTWDAGPNHPYAEVWYKVNNGADTFLVELGKGSRQMPVERGKVYTFILTDAGTTLATISVAGQ